MRPAPRGAEYSQTQNQNENEDNKEKKETSVSATLGVADVVVWLVKSQIIHLF